MAWWMRPCPLSSLVKNRAPCGNQCRPSPPKDLLFFCIPANNPGGGSTHTSLCYSWDATRLFKTRNLHLKDINRSSHFHLTSFPSIFSVMPSQFFWTIYLFPRHMPRYFRPPFFQVRLWGRTGRPSRHSPTVIASLSFQFALAADKLENWFMMLIKISASLWFLIKTMMFSVNADKTMFPLKPGKTSPWVLERNLLRRGLRESA